MKNVVIGLWLLLGIGYWAIAKYACADKGLSSQSVVVSPYTFEAEGAGLTTSEAFESYADSLRNTLGPKDKLRLTGLLSTEEAAINKDLGSQRAEALLQALNIDASRAEIGSLTLETLPSHRRYVEVKRLSGESAIVERVVSDTGDINKHSTIYFPFNSTDKLDDARVEKFLNGIAIRVQGTGERILLVGHTDKIGPRRYNYHLGDRRAKSIKYYLISRGVNPQKIITQSKGELSQVSNSDGEEASDINRRTEVKLLR